MADKDIYHCTSPYLRLSPPISPYLPLSPSQDIYHYTFGLSLPGGWRVDKRQYYGGYPADHLRSPPACSARSAQIITNLWTEAAQQISNWPRRVEPIAEDPHATEVRAPGRFACEHERRNCTFRPLRSEAATRAMRNPKLGYAFAKKGGGSLRALPPRNAGRKDSLGAAFRNVVDGGGSTSAARADAVAAGFLARERSRAQAAAAARAAIEKRQDDIVVAAAAAPAVDACPRAAALVARLGGFAPEPVQPRMSGRGAAWDARIRKHAERGVDKAGTAANEAAELRHAHRVVVEAARQAIAHGRRNVFGDTTVSVLGHEVRLLDRTPFLPRTRRALTLFALHRYSSPCTALALACVRACSVVATAPQGFLSRVENDVKRRARNYDKLLGDHEQGRHDHNLTFVPQTNTARRDPRSQRLSVLAACFARRLRKQPGAGGVLRMADIEEVCHEANSELPPHLAAWRLGDKQVRCHGCPFPPHVAL